MVTRLRDWHQNLSDETCFEDNTTFSLFISITDSSYKFILSFFSQLVLIIIVPIDTVGCTDGFSFKLFIRIWDGFSYVFFNIFNLKSDFF